MKVLIVAPHPFYQERGTPIAVDLLLRALSERGDRVDLLTFDEGSDRVHPGVRIHRIRGPLFGRQAPVPPGFSLRKLGRDARLFTRLVGMLRRGDYDLVHAIEESAFMALVVRPFTRVPFIYDMDSQLSGQLLDRFNWLRPAAGVLRYAESLPMRRAIAVVPMCEALADEARRQRARNVTVLKDISLLGEPVPPAEPEWLRETLGIDGPIVMYIGNLERYQGIDLLLEGFAAAGSDQAQLVIIGGQDEHVTHYREKAATLGIAERTHLLGRRPVDLLAHYMAQADILASPRTQGLNTPMKVYTYLDSGVPVIATRLPTHTQVMSDDIATLTEPEAKDFGAGLRRLLADPEHGRAQAERARAFIAREHSYEAFRRTLHDLYRRLEQELRPDAERTGE